MANRVTWRRQGLKHFSGPRPIWDSIVLSNCSVAKNQDTFSKLCDVVFVRDKNDCETLVVQVLEDVHDLDGGAAIRNSSEATLTPGRTTVPRKRSSEPLSPSFEFSDQHEIRRITEIFYTYPSILGPAKFSSSFE